MVKKVICKLDGNDGSFPQPSKSSFIYRVEPGTTVSFQIEAGSVVNTENTVLILDIHRGTNPETQATPGSFSPLGHWICDVTFSTPGNYNIFIEYTDKISKEKLQGSVNYLIVDPEIKIGGKVIPINGICMQSVLSRSLGPINRWFEVLKHQNGLGYNLFHLTPIQELGPSQSLYSINDPNKLNPELFPGLETEETKTQALQNVLAQLESEGVGCIQDVVLNHSADGCPFLEEHPNATYNLKNCPYLTVAYELDKALCEFSTSLWKRCVKNYGNRNRIENERDLSNIIRILRVELLPSLRLQEYFQINTEKAYEDFKNNETHKTLDINLAQELLSKGTEYFMKKYAVIGEGEGRFLTTINGELVWRAFNTLKMNREAILSEAKKLINGINSYLLGRYERHQGEIISNIEGDIRYHKIEQNNVEITPANPLVKPYFYQLRSGDVALFNGFIIGYNEVLKDFADKEGWQYFRRNVVIWSDCIKLRYGSSRDDCPELWDRMENYVTNIARIFKGIRLDNAHSTPLHVSEYLLSKARLANPNLFVIAELFTSDQNTDSLFVRRLGINCLIREAMMANNPRTLGRLVYEHGNGEIASLGSLEETDLNNSSLLGIQHESGATKLIAWPVPAIFYDCTHDNETPAQKRTAQDALPNAAMVAMCNCAISSTRGYDELIPKQLSVVTERRLYKLPVIEEQKVNEIKVFEAENEEYIKVFVEYTRGEPAREIFIKGEWDGWANPIHLEKSGENNMWKSALLFPKTYAGREFNYKYIVDGVWLHDPKFRFSGTGAYTNNILSVNPQAISPGNSENLCPAKKYLNLLHTYLAENGYNELYVHQCTEDMAMVIRQNPKTLESYVLVSRSAHYNSNEAIAFNGLKLPGLLDRVEFIATLAMKNARFEEHHDFVNGLAGNLEFTTNLAQFCNVSRDITENVDVLNFFRIPQAFIAIVKTKLNAETLEGIEKGYEILASFHNCKRIFEGLNLQQVNHILWRCSQEELDVSGGKRDVYGIPGYKAFNYAGLGGLVVEFLPLTIGNRLGHEIFNNLRQGSWLIDYNVSRLQQYELPARLQQFIHDHFGKIKSLPRGVIPKHFVKTVFLLFRNIKLYVLRDLFKGSKLFNDSDDSLVDYLGVAVSQFWGRVPSARSHIGADSLSAGLPHFSVGFMRCWGRDTFISLRGLLLCTGMWQEARETIITYASVMQNGLIPNLLDSGNNSRYNARDATWFFMQAIQDYIKMSPEGPAILQEMVKLRFKNGEVDHSDTPPIQLAEIVHIILQAHARGIEFRERNAGTRIDAHMRDEGFNIKISFDPHTGFIYGGNRWNCGTWMDKMGSSPKAGNKGAPATPRDGAAIEIIALLYSSIDFFAKLFEEGKFPYQGVTLADHTNLSYHEWKTKIEQSFENYFFIPEDGNSPQVNRKHLGIPGIYKDTLRSSLDYTDYQLRPNQCIAMAVASKLFNPEHAAIALNQITKYLMPGVGRGQVGIRTLNEEDRDYKPFYDNSNDSNDYSIAQGFSYHNGPEWVWPVGYYLRALLTFDPSKKDFIMKCLKEHRTYIENSAWMSICELTDRGGKENKFSSMAQAWSVSTLIEVLYELR